MELIVGGCPKALNAINGLKVPNAAAVAKRKI